MMGASLVLAAWSVCLSVATPELGISGSSFTLDGRPTFLLGASYYGALGVENPAFVQKDLDDLRSCGFNWIRVWATWRFEEDLVSAVDTDGSPREPYLSRLVDLCGAAAKRGMVVDVTLTRDNDAGFPSSLEEHKAVAAALAKKLRPFRNVYFDVGNERNCGDDRHVPMKEVGEVIAAIKEIDPKRLCTASQGGDISPEDVVRYIRVGKVDFITPHRPRNADSPKETADKTREYLDTMKKEARIVPVHYQEPFRRDYGEWNPTADDFMKDLCGAKEGGAAGWCFHNGATRADDKRPRRSFDMRTSEGRLFDQLDAEERGFLDRLRKMK